MSSIPNLGSELIAILPEIILVIVGFVLLVWGAGREAERQEGLPMLAAVGTLAALVSLVSVARLGAGPFLAGAVFGDTLGLFLRGVLYLGAFLVILSGQEFVWRTRIPAGEFYGLFLLSMAGGGFMAAAANVLTVYVGLELLSFSSYILAGLRSDDERSNEAALKYFLNGAASSAILLFGLSWLYGLSGTLDLLTMAERLAASSASPILLVIALAFVIAGFGFKLASVPFHLWVPDVYQGSPTPVTAFLSVGSKGAALAGALRLFYIGLSPLDDRWTQYWAILAAITMTWGNVSALRQTNIKRLFAYSSIAQAGYAVVGLATGSSVGIAAAIFFLLAYTVTNLGAFAVITAVSNAGGSEELAGFSGLARRNPFLAVAMLVFFLSLIGIPFTAGFFGKFYLIGAAVNAGLVWLAVLTAVNSAISVGYYYNVVRNMFLREADDSQPEVRPGPALATAVVISLVGTLGVGILPQFVGWAQLAAALP